MLCGLGLLECVGSVMGVVVAACAVQVRRSRFFHALWNGLQFIRNVGQCPAGTLLTLRLLAVRC